MIGYSRIKVNRVFQDGDTPTGDTKTLDENGVVWVKDYQPDVEATGEKKGIRKGGFIYPKNEML